MACRTAGRVGCGGGPLILFFPRHFCEAAMLEEGVGDHCHQYMTMKTLPRPPLEVVETKFLLELLMGLLADPPRLNCGRQLRRFISAGRLAR